jgi:lipooligosaccharide transport system permease protein
MTAATPTANPSGAPGTPIGGPQTRPLVPPISTLASIGAAYEHNFLLYRRTWRGSIFSSFLSPVMFLIAMGIGLGTYVNATSAASVGGAYLQFLAPGLLAATLMQTASFESAFPVIGGFNWDRRFHAMHAAPLTPFTIAAGHVAWLSTRLVLVGVAFGLVMVLFGAARSPLFVLAVPAAVLTGLAFATPLTAYMATQRNPEHFFYLFRFAITPLFLFSGTFFPIDRLPNVIQPIAWITPLWHGVDLCRALALGTATQAPLLQLVHVAYLATFAIVGMVLTTRQFARRLEA